MQTQGHKSVLLEFLSLSSAHWKDAFIKKHRECFLSEAFSAASVHFHFSSGSLPNGIAGYIWISWLDVFQMLSGSSWPDSSLMSHVIVTCPVCCAISRWSWLTSLYSISWVTILLCVVRVCLHKKPHYHSLLLQLDTTEAELQLRVVNRPVQYNCVRLWDGNASLLRGYPYFQNKSRPTECSALFLSVKIKGEMAALLTAQLGRVLRTMQWKVSGTQVRFTQHMCTH